MDIMNENFNNHYDVNSLKNGLVTTTEKGLKDAVTRLRDEMIEITSRIEKIEEMLNRMSQMKERQNCICFQQKVTNFIHFIFKYQITSSL